MEASAEEFETLVADALDQIPPELARLLDNVVVLLEPSPPAGEPGLLGLYEGVPLTERDSAYTFLEPDRITIFTEPLLRRCTTPVELVEQVRITVVHEVAHHFGIDDDALHEWGYG